MDVENNVENNGGFFATRRKREIKSSKVIYKYAGAISMFLLLIDLPLFFQQDFSENNPLSIFFAVKFILRFMLLPYNYVFELYPILEQRKGNVIDTSDRFLGCKSMVVNFISCGFMIEWRGLLYTFIGLFMHIGTAVTKLGYIDASGITLALSGLCYLKLKLAYPEGFKTLYE